MMLAMHERALLEDGDDSQDVDDDEVSLITSDSSLPLSSLSWALSSYPVEEES